VVHLTRQAHELFARQHGAASVGQLLDAQLTARQIRHLEQAGSIAMVLRGAYRSPSVADGELSRCAAVCLARSDVAVAGPTAGRLWGFRRLPDDRRIHVLAPRASNPAIAAWVVPYRTDARHDIDVVGREDGIRLTTRSRTAFDLARWLRPDDLLSVIEQAMHDGRLTEGEMFDVAVDWLSPQRPWARRYLLMLERRLPGGTAESHPEVRVAIALVRLGVRGLVRQHRIELPDHRRARFDLAVPELRWAIEVDLHPTHRQTAGILADERRDRAANAIGWVTTRITKSQYDHDFDQTMARVAAEHADHRSRPRLR